MVGDQASFTIGEARYVHSTALNWMGQNKTRNLSYVLFLRLANYYKFFQTICFPSNDCLLTKRTLTRHIELQTIPTKLTSYMVDKFYSATKVSKMGFALFAVLMHYSDVFT